MVITLQKIILKLLNKIKKIKIKKTISYQNALFKECKNFTLLDIGAKGEIEPRWKNVAKHLDYIGIEPDERSYKSLRNSEKCKSYTILKNLTWEEDKNINFNLCKEPGVSSILEPDINFLNRFQNADRFKIVEKKILKAESINNTKIENDLDFVKLDIQGAELSALKGMNTKLSNCLGMEIEVEFSKMYKNQPLFGDVNNFLSNLGFEFIDFTNLIRWERNQFTSYGQCVFADALWLRSPEQIDIENIQKLNKYISICSLYGRFDLIDSLNIINKKILNRNQIIAISKLKNTQYKTRLIQKFIQSILLTTSGETSTRSHLLY